MSKDLFSHLLDAIAHRFCFCSFVANFVVGSFPAQNFVQPATPLTLTHAMWFPAQILVGQ
jgi:hypothetical protein